MNDPHAERLQRLEQSVLRGPGTLDAAVRQAAASGGELPAPLAAFVDKVRRHAYKVTDADLEALRRAGCSADQIFELTISTALGAAKLRLDRGLAALKGES
jgi:alkylhydroperoxidase family enzyme